MKFDWVYQIGSACPQGTRLMWYIQPPVYMDMWFKNVTKKTSIILDLYKDDNRVLFLSIIVPLDVYPSLPLSLPPPLTACLLDVKA